jgi:hypothetical protein
MHRFLSHPEVAGWLRPQGVVGPFTPDECKAWARRDEAHWAAHGFGPWLAWDEDLCVGRSVLKHTVVAGRGEVEIGWAVARGCWGLPYFDFAGAANSQGLPSAKHRSPLRTRHIVQYLLCMMNPPPWMAFRPMS